ncbi:hypothetical protein GOBAR_AA29571 [Gossypium barbadense]|uniref:Uncharacterized protein n=1 Tax=Gossypium barbadense TaxID=3634 RepID=A0A2P5WJ50_GOSBA|nr:hypothetical protein GOBAR_AA29571 [Gossypium barbadense]
MALIRASFKRKGRRSPKNSGGCVVVWNAGRGERRPEEGSGGELSWCHMGAYSRAASWGSSCVCELRTIINIRIGELTLRAGDDAVTLQARDSVKTSKTQDNAIKPVDDKTNIQLSLQEPLRTKTTEIMHYYHVENKDVHEERQLQIKEQD